MTKLTRLLSAGITCIILASCASGPQAHPMYAGPKRPAREVAVLTRPQRGLSLYAQINRVDGTKCEHFAVELLPGAHQIEILAVSMSDIDVTQYAATTDGPFKAYINGVSVDFPKLLKAAEAKGVKKILSFNAEAGTRYQIHYEDDGKHINTNTLRIERL